MGDVEGDAGQEEQRRAANAGGGAACCLGFERDEGKVSIYRGIEGQRINILPLSRGQKMFSTGAKV